MIFTPFWKELLRLQVHLMKNLKPPLFRLVFLCAAIPFVN
jgi:hypothetical protein